MPPLDANGEQGGVGSSCPGFQSLIYQGSAVHSQASCLASLAPGMAYMISKSLEFSEAGLRRVYGAELSNFPRMWLWE